MKTVTYNPLTHKIVPIEPDENMCRALFINLSRADSEKYVLREVILAAPEYQDIEQTPVAIIGNDFQLLYAQIGSISEIVKLHELGVGTLLYAMPPAPEGDNP